MLFAVIVVLLVVVVVFHVVFPRNYVSPRDFWLLRKIPGLPGEVPFFGYVPVFRKIDEFLMVLFDVCNEHKPIFRLDLLGITHVFLTDAKDLSVIFNSRLHIEKSEDYLFLVPWLGTGLLTSTGKKWAEHRKLFTPAFHFQILEQYTDVLDKHGKILVDQISARTRDDFVEINPLISLCTLDVICETAMGTAVNAQLGGEEDFVKATVRMGQIFQTRLVTPWMYRPFLFRMQSLGREQARLLRILHGFTEKVIRERRDAYRRERAERADEELVDDVGVKKKTSFLDLMIRASESDNSITEEEIREEVDTFMFEGHDTTAAAISWALFELGHHPQVQDRVYREQFDIFGDSDRAVASSDLPRMKYLERVIKETLRLYPSVPIISRRLETDATIRGYRIPAGTNIPAFIFYHHRNPELYPDPERFDPDRFLSEKLQGRHPYAYIPFSAGSRNCIGQRFAEMELKSVLSHVVRNFRFKSLDARDGLRLKGELILRPKNNLRISFEPRSRSGDT